MTKLLRRHLLALMLGVTAITFASPFVFDAPAIADDDNGGDDNGSSGSDDNGSDDNDNGSDDDDNGSDDDDNGSDDDNNGTSGGDGCRSDPLTCQLRSLTK